MEKALELLKQLKEDNKEYLPLLNKIEKYVRGQISSQQLINATNNDEKKIIFIVLNRLIKRSKFPKLGEEKYWIYLSSGVCFDADSTFCCIEKGKKDGIFLNFTGNNEIARRYKGVNASQWTSITGNFANYPDGIMLYESDWARIIAKHPNVFEIMYSNIKGFYTDITDRYEKMTWEESKSWTIAWALYQILQPREEEASNISEEAQYLPKEIIDSIKFEVFDLLKFEQIESGNFTTFEELLDDYEEVKNQPTEIEQILEKVEEYQKEYNIPITYLRDYLYRFVADGGTVLEKDFLERYYKNMISSLADSSSDTEQKEIVTSFSAGNK